MKNKIIINLLISISLWCLLFLALDEYVYMPAALAVVGVISGYGLSLFIGGSSLRISLLAFLVPLAPFALVPFLQDPANLLFTYLYITIVVFSIGIAIRLLTIFIGNIKRGAHKNV